MSDNDSVKKLVPFLQKQKIDEDVESRVNVNDININAVQDILDV